METKKLKVEKELSVSIKKADNYPYQLMANIDLETFAKESNKALLFWISVIVSDVERGEFTKNKMEFFLAYIDIGIDPKNVEGSINDYIATNGNYDVELNTVKFWTNPKQKVVFDKYLQSKDKKTLKKALLELSDFLAQFDIKKFAANSPAFDLAILENAYNSEGIADKIPWNYYETFDVRTIRKISGSVCEFRKGHLDKKRETIIGIAKENGLDLMIKHDPVYDCLDQQYDMWFFFYHLNQIHEMRKTFKQSNLTEEKNNLNELKILKKSKDTPDPIFNEITGELIILSPINLQIEEDKLSLHDSELIFNIPEGYHGVVSQVEGKFPFKPKKFIIPSSSEPVELNLSYERNGRAFPYELKIGDPIAKVTFKENNRFKLNIQSKLSSEDKSEKVN